MKNTSESLCIQYDTWLKATHDGEQKQGKKKNRKEESRFLVCAVQTKKKKQQTVVMTHKKKNTPKPKPKPKPKTAQLKHIADRATTDCVPLRIMPQIEWWSIRQKRDSYPPYLMPTPTDEVGIGWRTTAAYCRPSSGRHCVRNVETAAEFFKRAPSFPQLPQDHPKRVDIHLSISQRD